MKIADIKLNEEQEIEGKKESETKNYIFSFILQSISAWFNK